MCNFQLSGIQVHLKIHSNSSQGKDENKHFFKYTTSETHTKIQTAEEIVSIIHWIVKVQKLVLITNDYITGNDNQLRIYNLHSSKTESAPMGLFTLAWMV